MPERITDPRDVPVQLNIKVPWRMRERLHALAEEKRISFSQLVRDAIDDAYPEGPDEVRKETAAAGSTR